MPLLTGRWLLGAVLAAAVTACGLAPAPTTVTTPTPRPTSPPCDDDPERAWGLFGTVTDLSGAPIEEAVVEVESGDFFGTASTTAEGTFAARCVWGVFQVSVAHLDYEGIVRTFAVDPGERREVTIELEPFEP